MVIRDVMSPRFTRVGRQTSLLEAALALVKADVDVAVVDGTPAAILTDSDIVRAVADGRDPGRTAVAEYMGYAFRHVGVLDDLDSAAVQARIAGHRYLVVFDHDVAVGLVAADDVVRAVMHAGGTGALHLVGRPQAAIPVR